MAGLVVELSDASFEQEVLQSPVPVLVDFWAPWCGPCRAIAPAVEAISTEFSGKLKVCKVNVDQARQAAVTYRVESIPLLVLFNGGQVVDRLIGAHQKEKIVGMIMKHTA